MRSRVLVLGICISSFVYGSEWGVSDSEFMKAFCKRAFAKVGSQRLKLQIHRGEDSELSVTLHRPSGYLLGSANLVIDGPVPSGDLLLGIQISEWFIREKSDSAKVYKEVLQALQGLFPTKVIHRFIPRDTWSMGESFALIDMGFEFQRVASKEFRERGDLYIFSPSPDFLESRLKFETLDEKQLNSFSSTIVQRALEAKNSGQSIPGGGKNEEKIFRAYSDSRLQVVKVENKNKMRLGFIVFLENEPGHWYFEAAISADDPDLNLEVTAESVAALAARHLSAELGQKEEVKILVSGRHWDLREFGFRSFEAESALFYSGNWVISSSPGDPSRLSTPKDLTPPWKGPWGN